MPGNVADFLTGRQRIGRAHVRNQPYVVVEQMRQQAFDPPFEQRVVTQGRVLPFSFLRQCNGSFGEAFQHQVIQLSLLRQNNGRFEPVARKTSATANTNGFVGGHLLTASLGIGHWSIVVVYCHSSFLGMTKGFGLISQFTNHYK